MRDDIARSQAVGRRRALVFALLVSMVGLVLTGLGQGPAEAEVTEVKGSACGYITNVGLFGGPQAKLGCEPQSGTPSAPATAGTLSPSVALPAGGSATAVTAEDPEGAAGVYGPATIFGGLWPEDVASSPGSGPIRVSTQGTPAGGSVTSSAEISLHPTPIPVRCYTDPPGTTNCQAPGGFGPAPVEGDSLLVECHASESAVTGSTRFVNGVLSTSTDAEGSPVDQEPIPDEPPVNYTRSGVITNVGDVFTVVFNEQIVNADGSLTVNAVHMYLFGPTAVGEMIKGQATCGSTPSAISPNDTVAPTCGTPVVEPMAPDNPTPKSPLTERVGVFDAGGLQSITNPRATNGTVNVPPKGTSYLQFNPGQTGPLPITATRTDESQPLIWSFVATDVAGNTTTCQGVNPDPTIPTTSTTLPAGGTPTTLAPGATTTTRATTSTTAASGVTTTTSGSGAGRVQSADPLLAGRTVTLVVRELPASTAVNGTLESTLVNLPTVTTDSAGTARFSVVLPADFEAPGTHVLTVRSVTSNAILANLRLTVDAAGRIVSAENVGPAGTGGGILARTGSVLRIPLALALALAMVAWGWMLVQQGRRVPARR